MEPYTPTFYELTPELAAYSTPPMMCFYYPATWSTLRNKSHCSIKKPTEKKPPEKNGFSIYNCFSKKRRGTIRQQKYQLASQSSDDSVDSL